MGRQALNYLKEHDLGRIVMTNRTHHKSLDLQGVFPDVDVIPYDDRYDLLGDMDVLITATASPHTVIRNSRIGGRDKPLLILDMALPRDVDPKVGEREDVKLFVVDDLREISERNMKKRRALCEEALLAREPEIRELGHWLKTMKVDPLIGQLKQRADQIGDDTLDYLNKKLKLDLKESKLLDKMVHSALKRMIREPILQLKSMKDIGEQEKAIEVLEQLFQLEEDK